MAFDPAFLDELRARTPIASVVGRRTKLARSGRNWKACCPFHGEKTPSFYVYDDHFHCFGCGAHGDAISFVMQSQGSSFLDAVQSLAAEAGLEVPKAGPREEAAQARARSLGEVLAAAQAEYRRRLRLPEGEAGLAYLRRRGLSDGTIDAFGLGWSGDGRGLAAVLERDGFTPAQMAEAGLMRVDEEGRPKGELFFNRVTFPIADRRGQIVSFGGRILGEGQPKYLNGPETPLFSKRRLLFALDRARTALRAHRAPGAEPVPLLVVEGYMDAIALHQAGFPGAVAPLGTALTPEQLEALWQLAPMPVLCFDGDKAGRRAARRAAEAALPLLGMERSLRLVSLPDGEDPDSLVRKEGAAAMQALVAAAPSLSEALFDLLREGDESSVEGRAALKSRLDEAASAIPVRALADEYRAALRDRFYTTFRKRPERAPFVRRHAGNRRQDRWATPAPVPLPPRRPPDADAATLERQRVLTVILLRHPELLHDLEEAYAALPLPDSLHALRAGLLDVAHTPQLDSTALMDHLHAAGLSEHVATILSVGALPLPACASAGSMPAEAEAGWWHHFGLLMQKVSLDEEVRLAEREFVANCTLSTQLKLTGLRRAQFESARGEIGEDDAGEGAGADGDAAHRA